MYAEIISGWHFDIQLPLEQQRLGAPTTHTVENPGIIFDSPKT